MDPASSPASCPPRTAVSSVRQEGAEVLVRLTSILDPLPLHALFTRRAPVEIELGSGDGGFLMRYARLHPDRNFLGVERLFGRLNKLERKAPRLGLTNVRGLRLEAAYLVRHLLPPESAEALHIYFPDPWPKKRHRSRRLIDAEFPARATRVLVPGGQVFLRTDDADYFAQMLEVFAATTDFLAVITPAELQDVRTDFEEVFVQQGKPTLRAAYQVVP